MGRSYDLCLMIRGRGRANLPFAHRKGAQPTGAQPTRVSVPVRPSETMPTPPETMPPRVRQRHGRYPTQLSKTRPWRPSGGKSLCPLSWVRSVDHRTCGKCVKITTVGVHWFPTRCRGTASDGHGRGTSVSVGWVRIVRLPPDKVHLWADHVSNAGGAKYRRAMRMSPGRRATAMTQKAVKDRTQSTKSAKRGRQGGDLEKTLALIRARPGIRPSEINRMLKRDESDGLRATLIKRGLIRKEKDGSATRYYPV